jgi:tetratricopeptide (TPR) repeat protein
MRFVVLFIVASVSSLAAQEQGAAALLDGSSLTGADAALESKRRAANELWTRGKVAEAADRYREILHGDELDGSKISHRGADLFSLGSVLVELNHLDEAKSCFERALAFYQDHPIDSAEVRVSLAGIQIIQGSFAEAERGLKTAIAALTKYVSTNDVRTARAWNVTAWLYTIWGRLNNAEEASRKAQTIAERVLPPDNVERCRFLDYRAEYLAAMGRFSDAERLWRQATDLLAKSAVDTISQYDSVYLHLAQAYSWTGDYTLAQEMLNQFLSIERKILPTGSIAQAVGLAELGNTYTHLRQYADSESNLTSSMDMLARLPSQVPLAKAFVKTYLGDYYMARGRSPEAESSYRNAMELRQQAAPESALLAASMSKLAAALEKLKRKDEAKKYKEQAQAIQAVQHNPAYRGETVDVKSFRAK